jgi:pimeloyl-ACP methyl ester carboxylesterase
VQPDTRYAKSGDIHIAYQLVGSGPPDLVVVPGFVSHVERLWDEPRGQRFLHRLASFCRVLIFDKRGTGLSDRVATIPTLEQRMDDVRAVMDATGTSRAAILGASEGGAMSALFAATFPERTSALILYAARAKWTWAEDYPWARTRAETEARLANVEQFWGTGASVDLYAPSLSNDNDYRQWTAVFERSGASPGSMLALIRMNMDLDVRTVLPAIRVPTLVLHRNGDRAVPVENGRYLARHIPDAQYVELEGIDHLPWAGDVESLIQEIARWLTGVSQVPELDRVLVTVLFTDIVGATERVATLGDRGWRELLTRHHSVVRKQLERFRGREIDTAGDGFLATFDGPARAVRAACAMRDAVRPLGIQIRAGLHTGECEVIGEKLGGIAVHTGARVAALASPDEVLVSSTVKDLVAGSGLRFQERGLHVLRGVPGEWRLFAVDRAE